MKPARGITLFRKVETDDRIGSIIAPSQYVDAATAFQGEIVAVGLDEWCEAEETEKPCGYMDHEHGAEPIIKGRKFVVSPTHPNPPLKAGDWVLLKPRSWVETDERGVYAVRTSDILGLFRLTDSGSKSTSKPTKGCASNPVRRRTGSKRAK